MTNNNKKEIQNVILKSRQTGRSSNLTSSMLSAMSGYGRTIKITNLEKAKLAFEGITMVKKLTNLEKAKEALSKINHPIFSVQKDYSNAMGYKVTCDRKEDELKAQLLQHLMEAEWTKKFYGWPEV